MLYSFCTLKEKKNPYCIQKYFTHPKVFKLISLSNIHMISLTLTSPALMLNYWFFIGVLLA